MDTETPAGENPVRRVKPLSKSDEHQPFDVKHSDPEPVFPIPDLPWDVTSVSDVELMDHFSKQMAWQNYFATEMAQADLEETEAEAVVKTEEAKVMLNGGKLNDARLKRDTDPTVEKLRGEYRLARARRKMLQVAYENRDRCINLLSRELTRRVGREGIQRRADRFNP